MKAKSEGKMGGGYCRNLIEMAPWIEKHKDNVEKCAPCTLSMVSQWYKQTLPPDTTASLQELVDKKDAVAIAKELDNIKSKATPQIKDRLLDFDCSAQSFIEEN